MPKLIYNTKNKTITQEGYSYWTTKKTESIFTQGNGYLGLRAVDEERVTQNKEDFFINGLFNKGDNNESTELANLADSLQTTIIIDNEIFSITDKTKYRKTLDLKNGVLTREVFWNLKNKKFKFLFERIVDQKNKNLYAQKITITQLSGEPANLMIFPMINAQTTNSGVQHFNEGTKHLIDINTIQCREVTNQSNDYVVHTMYLKVCNGSQMLHNGNDDFVIKMARRQVGFQIKAKLQPNQAFVLEKIMSVFTTVDKDTQYDCKVIDKSLDFYETTMREISFDKLVVENKKYWDKIYKQFDIKISGTSKDAKYDQLALMFSIYHLNHFVAKDNSNVSVGAKGLSGEGYQGHAYWDTEFFIMPNYLFTEPHVARNMLEYRYKGIDGARKKAAEKNLKGAQYPWEMARPEDGEVTPYWGQPDIKTGEQVPIASREQEIHVSGDIAYAVEQYYQVTKDQQFMDEIGYEMIIDTAIFWAERAEKISDKYQITNVMGPNEYKGNIDNNNFINLIARNNLLLAIKYLKLLNSTTKGKELLAKINNKIPYYYSIDKMQDVADNLVQQLPNKDLVVAENDQFLHLPLNDVSNFQMLGDAGKKLFSTEAGYKLLGSQLVKQADVVLSMYIFSHLFDLKTIEANFNYYEPITTHDSSLSATTYAIIAIMLRKMDIAYKLFKYSIDVDLGTNFFSSDAGIHAGSLAAIWQTTVFGYGGMKYSDGNLHFDPILPEQWNKLEYSIIYQGYKIAVVVNRDDFALKLVSKNNKSKVKVFVNNEIITLTNKLQNFKVVKKW
ncbi:glycosyl hydrolase family 65 protein [Candidatus Mycoplasma pogonae]